MQISCHKGKSSKKHAWIFGFFDVISYLHVFIQDITKLNIYHVYDGGLFHGHDVHASVHGHE